VRPLPLLPIADGRTRLRVTVTLACLAANLVSVVLFNRFVGPQGYEYETIARNLLTGAGYTGSFMGGQFGPTSYMAPLYPVLIYLDFLVFGPGKWLPIQLLQTMLLSLVPLLLLRIRQTIFPEQPQLSPWVLVLPAVVPFTMFSGYIGPAALLTMFTTAGFALFFAAARQPKWRYFLALGLLAGVTGLTDPVPLLLFAAGFLWLLVRQRGRLVLRWLAAGTIALLIVSPWLYRNYRLFGAFPAIKIQGGWNLWWGNNPLATGGIHNRDGGEYTAQYDALSPEEEDSLLRWNEWERDRFFARKARKAIVHWLTHDPLGYARLKLKSLMFFWFGDAWSIGLERTLVLRGANPRLAVFFFLTLIPSLLLLVGAVVGVATGITGKSWRADTLLVTLVVLLWAGAYALTHGHTFTRYRVPLDPVLLLFGLMGFDRLLSRSTSHAATHDAPSR